MPYTLNDLKNEADRRLANDSPLEALKVYRLVLEAVPLDFDIRLVIGDCVAMLGNKTYAMAIYRAVATHSTKEGNPLRGMAALKRMEMMSGDVKTEVNLLIEKYSSSSQTIGRGIKAAPTDYSQAIRDDIDLGYPIPPEKLIHETTQMAAYLDNIKNYPTIVPPIPIFSNLEQSAFAALFKKLELKRFVPGQPIIRQGDPGHEVFFLARGEVNVMVRGVSEKKGETNYVKVARLGPGSLFGEMAIVNDDPRSASVICDTPVDVLELTRKNIDELSTQISQVAKAMTNFTSERMIKNLLATNPLFAPFNDDAKQKLLTRFTGHEVPKGTIFLEQGNVGNGLYIILCGRAEVLKTVDDGEPIKLAELGPGAVAGEISVLFEEPVSATVQTTAPTTLFFLARELFLPLVEMFPEVLAHFNRLAEERLADTEKKMRPKPKKVAPKDETEAAIMDVLELDDDEIVFI